MALPIMQATDIKAAMKGYCRLVGNINDFAKDAIEGTITGENTTNGFFFGGLIGEPNFASEDELIDFSESVHGANGPYRGGWNIQSTTSTITATLMKLSVQNFKLLFADYQDGGAWGDADAAAASLTIGTGSSGVTYTAQQTGTASNSVRVAHIAPSTANAALSVTVSSNDITVNLATGATAGTVTSTAAQVRDAVNASATASVLVAASLPGDGTGIAVAAAMAALTGGSGTTYGQIITRSGNVLDSAYLDNVCLCFEGETDDEIGMVIRLNSVINRADSKEFSPDGDGNISGVEVELQGHQDLSSLSSTGQPLPPMSIYLPSYMAAA